MPLDWKAMLSSVAPMIGTAIGGPFGAVAAQAGLKMLGITPDAGNEEQQLQQALASATPADLLKLKQADQQFAKEMKALDVDVMRIDQADRGSARTMAKTNGIWPQVVLSTIYTIAYGVVLYCFMTGKLNVPEDQKILFGSLIGILTGAQVQILNFWFGSSSGSKQKTAALAGAK